MKKLLILATLFTASLAFAAGVTLKQIDDIQNSTGGPQIAVPANGSYFLTDFNLGTTANKALQLNGSGAVPAVDGYLLTNINAANLKGVAISASAPTGGQILKYNSSSTQWEPAADSLGTVTSVASGNGLLGGPITSAGTLSVDSGTGANQIVQLDGSARLPAVDGFALTNLNAANKLLSNVTSPTALPVALLPATTTTVSLGSATKRWLSLFAQDARDVSNVVEIDLGARQLVNGGGLNMMDWSGSNISFIGKRLTLVADPSSAQDAATKAYVDALARVTLVASGTGLLGGPISSVGTLSVDVGTGANQIVQLDGSARLPAVDGSQLTNLPASGITQLTGDVTAGPGTGSQAASVVKIRGVSVSSTAPTDGQILTYNNATTQWEPQAGDAANEFVQNGNSFGAIGVLGTNDNFALKFKSNNIIAQTIDTSQRVGLGSSSPDSRLMVSNNAAASVPPGTLTAGTVIHAVGVDASNARIVVDAFGTASNAGITLRKARGTQASPSAIQNNDQISGIFSAGYGASDYGSGRANIFAFASENWSNIAQGTYLTLQTTPVTTATAVERMRIDNAGFVGIGTTSPVAKLDVHGSSGATLKIVDANQAVSNVLQSDANGVASWVASLSDAASLLSVDYKNRVLVSSSGVNVVDYDNYVLNDNAAATSQDFNARILYASDASAVFNYSDPAGLLAYVKVQFQGAGGTTSLVGPDTGGTTFKLPAADGTNGQFMQTDGSGQLSFGTPGAPSLNGGSGSPQSVDPTPGVQLSSQSYVNKAWVVGNAGPVVVTNTPNVTPGNFDGEELIIIGTSDTNTVKLSDQSNMAGSGLALNGDVTLLANESITLHWDAAQTLWVEDARSY